MRGKPSSSRRINRHVMWAMTLLPLWVWSLTLVGSPALAQEEIVLGEFFLSGAAINATLELAPADTLNPGVLNGVLNQADSDGDGTPDHIQNADAHLELQVRYRRNAPNLGGRVSGEFVPFLRVSVSIDQYDDQRNRRVQSRAACRTGRRLALCQQCGLAGYPAKRYV